MVYTFDDAKAPSKRRTQYFEMFANRAIYNDGWVAATTPPDRPVGSRSASRSDVDDYKWELYNVAEDFSEAVNLADKEPAKLRELQDLFCDGLLVDRERMRRLSDFSKLKKIKISLDGADAETNDAIRSKGVFEKVMQNISLTRKEKRFEIIVMFTVMKKNFRNLPSLFKLCQDSGIDGLIIERFIPLGKGRRIVDRGTP